jgi:hypothetical protein
MSENDRTLAEAIHRRAMDESRELSMPAVQPPGIPYSELATSTPGDVFFDEWNTYCREIGRLLAEGLQGRYVAIKGSEIVGIYDTWHAAREAGLKRFLPEPFFVHPIRAEEPFLRVRGINLPCPS